MATENTEKFFLCASYISYLDHYDSLHLLKHSAKTLEQANIKMYIAALVQPWYEIAYHYTENKSKYGTNPRFRELVAKLASSAHSSVHDEDELATMFDCIESFDSFIDDGITLADVKELYDITIGNKFSHTCNGSLFDFKAYVIDVKTFHTVSQLQYGPST